MVRLQDINTNFARIKTLGELNEQLSQISQFKSDRKGPQFVSCIRQFSMPNNEKDLIEIIMYLERAVQCNIGTDGSYPVGCLCYVERFRDAIRQGEKYFGSNAEVVGLCKEMRTLYSWCWKNDIAPAIHQTSRRH